MSAINFVVRDPAGYLQHGSVSDSKNSQTIDLAAGTAVSLDVRRLDVTGYIRQGDDLVLMMSDGRKIILEDYYGAGGDPQARLFLNEGGHLIEAEVSATGTVVHSEVTTWGKWGDLDALAYPSDPVVASMPADQTAVASSQLESGTDMGGDTTMAAGFGVAPLAGVGGGAVGLGVLGAGVIGGAAALGGGGSGGGTGGSSTGSGATIVPTIDQADDNYAYNGESEKSLTITGDAEPGSTVEITIGDKTVTVIADKNGRYEAVFSGENFPADGSYNVIVVVTEPDGTVTTLNGQTIVIDTIAPELEVSGYDASVTGDIINAVEYDNGFRLEGTGEAGASVSITIDGVTRTTTVGGDGSWSFDFAAGDLPTGEYDIEVTVTSSDAYNNTTTVTHTMTIDTVAPDVAIGPGAQAGDNVVNAEEAAAGVDITGLAEPGSTVVVTMNGSSYTTTASNAGTWTVNFAAADFPAGEYEATITAVATDLAGNSTTTTSTIQVDTESGVTIDPGNGSGGETVVNGNTQSGGSVTLTGTTQPGSTVVVTINGVDYPATVDENGNWTVDIPGTDLGTGEYDVDVTVTSTDGSGNSSSTTGTVAVDTETVATISPVGGVDTVVSGAEASGGVTFTGTGEPGATIQVGFAGNSHTTTVDADGNWTVTFTETEVPSGEYSADLVVIATDEAGNTTTVTETVTVDTVTSVAAEVSGAGGDGVLNAFEAAAGLTVAGQSEPGSAVSVTIGTTTFPATVGADGSWSVTFPYGSIPDGEYTADVTVTSTDAYGNAATATTTLAIDTVVTDYSFAAGSAAADGILAGPEISGGLSFSGTVEPGSSLTMQIAGVSQAAVVDASGNWTVNFAPGAIPAGEYDTSMTVTAADAAGNIHMTTDVVRVDTVAGDIALADVAIEMDGVINAAERSDGVTIAGTATPLMTVAVELGGATMTTTADANGAWSVDFAAGQIPAGTYDASVTATITDAYGNTKSDSDTVHVDTLVENLASSGVVDTDGVVNGMEQADGITLTGKVEPGSVVSVKLGNVTQSASVAADGSWSVDFAAAQVPTGEVDVPVIVTATDAAGNTAMVTDNVSVDTEVNRLALNGTIGGDGYINASEAAMGLTLTGVTEAGSTVMVNFDGTARAASVDAHGNWSVDFTAAEVGSGEEQVNVTVTATDAAGNVDSITETATLDTEAPEAPYVTAFNRAGDHLRGFSVDAGDATAEITTLGLDGSEGTVGNISFDNPVAAGEVDFYFTEALPDGSHLVVTKTDDAGNESATLFALDEGVPDAIDLSNPGLLGQEIEAIDLRFAEDSTLTIDSSLLENLSSNSNTLTIHGSADDKIQVDTTDGATLTNTNQTVTIGGETYSVYTLGDEGGTLIIDDDIQFT